MLRRTEQILIAVIVAIVASQAVQAQEVERSLVGVWEVVTTPRNCATGVPIPDAAFESIYTFHKDGTMIVSFRNNSLTLERTAAHGLWRRVLGWSDYSMKFVHLRRNLSTGLFAGKQESTGSLVLDESGDGFSIDSLTQVYTPAGDPLPTTSCATSAGSRFTIDQA